MESQENLLTPREVAARLRVSYPTALRLIISGSLRGLRVSPGLIRVPETALKAYMEACATGSPARKRGKRDG